MAAFSTTTAQELDTAPVSLSSETLNSLTRGEEGWEPLLAKATPVRLGEGVDAALGLEEMEEAEEGVDGCWGSERGFQRLGKLQLLCTCAVTSWNRNMCVSPI